MSHNSPARASQRRWLLALIGAMTLLYTGLALTFPLWQWLPRGRISIGTVTDRSTVGALVLSLLGCALYACYVSGALLVWRGRVPRTMRWIWAGALASAGLLAWAYPVTSTDIFDYLFRSHMLAEYGANPYLQHPRDFKTDPWFRYVGWPNAPSAYGPLWELIGWQLARLGGPSSLLVNVLLLKALAIGAFASSGWLIQRLLRGHPQQQLGVFLWLWSPLALWEFAANGHNDGLLVVALLGALLAVRHNRHGLAVLVLTAGALFKFLPAIFLPLVVLHWMRRATTWPRRLLLGALSLTLFAVPTVLLYAPFWDVPPNFRQLGLEQQVAAIVQGTTTTLHNISVRENFLNASPLAVISYLLQTPTLLAQANTLFGTALNDAGMRSLVSRAGTLALGLGLAWQSWRVWHGHALDRAFWGLVLWYILAGSQWFQPWYVLWLLALFGLRPQRLAFAWLTVWALTAQASYLLQYTVFHRLGIQGQTLEAQVWYLVAIYLLPLCVWALLRWRSRQAAHRAALAVQHERA